MEDCISYEHKNFIERKFKVNSVQICGSAYIFSKIKSQNFIILKIKKKSRVLPKAGS